MKNPTRNIISMAVDTTAIFLFEILLLFNILSKLTSHLRDIILL